MFCGLDSPSDNFDHVIEAIAKKEDLLRSKNCFDFIYFVIVNIFCVHGDLFYVLEMC